MGKGHGYGRVERLDGCASFMKYILFAFNLLVLIGGLVIAIIGIIAVASDENFQFSEFDDNNLLKSAAFMQIVFGFLVVCFAFLGCCGAIKQSKCMLLTYATLTLIVFIVVLVAGIMAVVYKDQFKEEIEKELKTFADKYDENFPKQTQTKAWDTLHREGKCCGIVGVKTWEISGTFNGTGNKFPKSCCIKESDDSAQCDRSKPIPAQLRGNGQGCIVLVDKIVDFSSVLGYVAIAIAVILLLGVMFACAVGCSL